MLNTETTHTKLKQTYSYKLYFRSITLCWRCQALTHSSGFDGECGLAMDLPDSTTVQSWNQPSDTGSLGDEKLGPDQGGASWNQTGTKTITQDRWKIELFLFQEKEVRLNLTNSNPWKHYNLKEWIE